MNYIFKRDKYAPRQVTHFFERIIVNSSVVKICF